MAQSPTCRVAEQPVAVGDHLPSRRLITYRLPPRIRIPLQRLDTVGETEHQRRRHHLVGQADVGERSKPCRGRPLLDGLPHAFPHSPALALGRRNDAEGIVLPALRRLQTFTEFAEKRRQIHGRAVESKRVGEPVVVADIGRGLLPGLNEDVLLAEQLQARFELFRNHALAPQHLDQFRDVRPRGVYPHRHPARSVMPDPHRSRVGCWG